jgi:Fe2+ or Zn2+ uptake regulation protein
VEDILIDEFDLSRQEALLVEQKGFSVLRHSLEFFGLCKMCK